MVLFAAAVRSSPRNPAPRLAMQALDAGFARVGLTGALYHEEGKTWREHLPSGCVCCIELFLPFPRGLKAPAACPFHLDVPHPEEKRDAVKYGTETILFAVEHEVPVVTLPVVSLGASLRKAHARLLAEGEIPGLRAAIGASRSTEARPRFDALRSNLSRLLDEADRREVQLALTPGGWADEFPSRGEVKECLREFEGAPLRLWDDTWRRVLSLDAPEGVEAPEEASKARIAGITLRDHDAAMAECPLGDGTVDRDALRPLLEKGDTWMADPPGEATLEGFAASLQFLEGLERGPEPRIVPGFSLG